MLLLPFFNNLYCMYNVVGVGVVVVVVVEINTFQFNHYKVLT